MDRLISEQELIEHLKACFENGRPMYRPTLDEVSEMIKAIPSAEPKTGHWIVDLQTATEDYYICSECGRRIHLLYPDTIGNYPYCHCGARMESEKNE